MVRKKKTTREVIVWQRKTKNTKPADEEIEKMQNRLQEKKNSRKTEKAESDTAAAKEEQPEKKGLLW